MYFLNLFRNKQANISRYKNANDITVGTDMENEYDFDKMPGHCETFILILEDKQFQERTLYRIKKGK